MKPTAYDLSAVSQETADCIEELEFSAAWFDKKLMPESSKALHRAIDRLIVLDAGKKNAEPSPQWDLHGLHK